MVFIYESLYHIKYYIKESSSVSNEFEEKLKSKDFFLGNYKLRIKKMSGQIIP